MDNQYYDLFFGKKIAESIYPSKEEIDHSNYWILQKFNSFTSLSYITNAIIIFYFTNKFFVVNYLGGIISLLLGIASFFWWASKRDLIQRVDIALYSSLIFWPGIIILCIMNKEIQITIISIYFILTSYLVYMLYDNELDTPIIKYKNIKMIINKKFITILNLIGLIFSISLLIIFKTNEWVFTKVIIVSLTVLGFICKLSDTFQLLKPQICGAGTGWFHLFTALSLLVAWYLLQNINSHTNLPINNKLNNIVIL